MNRSLVFDLAAGTFISPLRRLVFRSTGQAGQAQLQAASSKTSSKLSVLGDPTGVRARMEFYIFMTIPQFLCRIIEGINKLLRASTNLPVGFLHLRSFI